MLLNLNRPRRVILNLIIAWVGDINGKLDQITDFCRLGQYRFGKPRFPDDDAGLAGDDSPTHSRTIRWTDGRNEILLWKLPSPGR